jgi:MinD-like ATPase involved in chromosome partitioning or flagellar assembly
MTEGQGKHSDDQASPPPRPPEFPERFANPSGPVPRRPESDPPEPPSAENDPSGDPPPGLGGGALRGDAPSSDPLPFEKVFKWPDQPGSQHLGAPDERAVVSDRSTGLGGGALGGDAPSSDPLPFEKLFQWPDQPGSQHLGAPDERAVVSDRSTASVPDWVAGHGDTPRPAPSIGPQDRGGPGEPVAQAPSPRPDRFAQHEQQPSDIAPRPGEPPPRPAPPIGPQDRGGPGEPVAQAPSPRPDRFAQHEQQPSDIAPRPGEPPPRPAPPIGPQDRGGRGEPVAQAPSPRPDRFAQHEQQPSDIASRSGEPPPRPGPGPARPGPSWQQPPAPAQQPPGGWPADYPGFNHAQGSAANRNYLDSIRSSELVPTRRIPPGRGWRKVLYIASFNLVNLGQSPDERYQGELETKIRSLLRGTYKIGVLGKGGVGKSTISASVGSVFAELRQDDRVVAIDADTGFGKLASRIDPAASGSYWELAADGELFTFSDIRSRVGNNKSGLFVLPGEAATARRRILDADIYRKASTKLDQHFTLSVVDCGSTPDSPVTREVLADVDGLIVVSSTWYDGASAAGQTLEWLANSDHTGLLDRTVVVINDSDGRAPKPYRALLVERCFGGRGHKVIEMPFDEHLRPGGVIDVREELNRLTRRRLMELAAACAEHFAATAERPRVLDDRHRRQGGHRRLRDADPGVEPGVAAGR